MSEKALLTCGHDAKYFYFHPALIGGSRYRCAKCDDPKHNTRHMQELEGVKPMSEKITDRETAKRIAREVKQDVRELSMGGVAWTQVVNEAVLEAVEKSIVKHLAGPERLEWNSPLGSFNWVADGYWIDCDAGSGLFNFGREGSKTIIRGDFPSLAEAKQAAQDHHDGRQV